MKAKKQVKERNEKTKKPQFMQEKKTVIEMSRNRENKALKKNSKKRRTQESRNDGDRDTVRVREEVDVAITKRNSGTDASAKAKGSDGCDVRECFQEVVLCDIRVQITHVQ